MKLSVDLVAILAQFHESLSLKWVSNNKSYSIFPDQYANWINRFDPDTNNVIEVIDNRIAKQLTASLLRDKPVTTYILVDDIALPDALQQRANQQQINILHSPCSSKRVITEIGWHMANSSSEACSQHGVFLRMHNLGVLITGASGCGKSSIALELIEKEHQLVADDAPLFYTFGEQQLYGICPPLLSGFLEIADMGVLNIDKLFGANASIPLNRINLVVELIINNNDNDLERLKSIHHYTTIAGVEIPVIRLFKNQTRNMATMVDTAVKNHVLYREGYDANAALIKKQQQAIKDPAQ